MNERFGSQVLRKPLFEKIKKKLNISREISWERDESDWKWKGEWKVQEKFEVVCWGGLRREVKYQSLKKKF